MKNRKKAKIGLLGLTFELYNKVPDLKPNMEKFVEELVDYLSSAAQISFPGVCDTRSQVSAAVAQFEADDVELLMVILLSYAPSHIALPALLKTKLPVLIFNTQRAYSITAETTPQVTMYNHGMHGVQDLANVLLRSGREFRIVTGHYQDEETLGEVKEWFDAARTAKFMRQCRIGLLGYPMEQMGDFGIDETAFLAQVGVEVRRIPMKQLSLEAADAPDADIMRQISFDKDQFEIDSGITQKEHEASSRLEWAIRKTLKEQNMNGFSAHFMAVADDGRLETLPFLAASKMMGEGYGYGGEGDVTSAAAVAMMQELVGAANFTEMFTMDFGGNAILMSHMGEGNWKLAREDVPVRMVLSSLGLVDLQVKPLLLTFALKPGDVTLVSLTTLANGKLKMIVTEGEVVDFPAIKALSTPHFKFAPQGKPCPRAKRRISDFLTSFSMEGGSHHQALAYGKLSSAVEKIAELLGIECSVV